MAGAASSAVLVPSRSSRSGRAAKAALSPLAIRRTGANAPFPSWRRGLRLRRSALGDRRLEIDAGLARKRVAELVAQHAGRHLLDGALGEFAELERPEGDADQPVHREAEMFEHALDLAVLALAQAHGEPDVGALHAVELRLDAGVVDAVDRDAFAQRVELRLIDLAMGAHAIAAQPAGRRQLEHPRQAAVVGQQQQPFGVDVEPADRRRRAAAPAGRASKIVGRPFGIARRRDEAARLVEQAQPRALALAQRLAVDARRRRPGRR